MGEQQGRRSFLQRGQVADHVPPALCKLLHFILKTTSAAGDCYCLFYRGGTVAPGRWGEGVKSHTQEGPGGDQLAFMDQGAVRACVEEELVAWLG